MRKYENKEMFMVGCNAVESSNDGEEFPVSRITEAEYFNADIWDGCPKIVWDGHIYCWKYDDEKWYLLENKKWIPCEEPIYEKWYKEFYNDK